MKTSAALALLVAGLTLLPAANARNITVRVDTPEFGFRIGHPGGYAAVGHLVPVFPVPVYGPHPVIVMPRPVYRVPVYLPPPRFIVPQPIYLPSPGYHPYGRGYAYPPGHDRKHFKQIKRHKWHDRLDDSRHRHGRDDD